VTDSVAEMRERLKTQPGAGNPVFLALTKHGGGELLVNLAHVVSCEARVPKADGYAGVVLSPEEPRISPEDT
jgi:hypothetical protein